ncbi:MAG: GDYXXLXY domain-containing protein [Verrucomicrobiales bacterium]
MKAPPLVLALFAGVCLLQWAVPASMIHKRESTLHHGEIYRFKTAPVDPYDAFRGRYVALNYEESTVAGTWPREDFRRGRVVFAVLGTDEEGFAVIENLVTAPPEEGDFLRVRVGYVYSDRIRIELPFDRFYMDEFSAPEAEREFLRANRNGGAEPAHVVARVRRGFGVIEDLIVGGQPVAEWLEGRR